MEIDWLYRDVARFFPEEWERFRDGVPEADRDGGLLAAYARLMARRNAYSDRPSDALLALVRNCAHYFSNGAWLEEGALLRDAGRLAGVQGVLVYGRHDWGDRWTRRGRSRALPEAPSSGDVPAREPCPTAGPRPEP